MNDSRLAAIGLRYSVAGRTILAGVSLTLRPGQWLAVVGPNGAGKSTLSGLLAGARLPHGGEVTLDGRRLHELPASARGRLIAYLPQQSPYPEAAQALDVVRLGRIPHLGVFGRVRAVDHAAVARAMALTAVEHLAALELGALSGGERQRVLLARALATEPRYLVLDEPTTFLDVQHQSALLDVILHLRHAGTGVITVLHDLNQALHADEVLLLDAGRVAAHGATASVMRTELLARVYGDRVLVGRTEDGELVVLPARPPRVELPAPDRGAAPRCGAGERR